MDPERMARLDERIERLEGLVPWTTSAAASVRTNTVRAVAARVHLASGHMHLSRFWWDCPDGVCRDLQEQFPTATGG